MRGAVSVALVYYYYESNGTEETNVNHATLISSTITVVLISTLIFGAVTKPLLDFMLGTQGGQAVQYLQLTCPAACMHQQATAHFSASAWRVACFFGTNPASSSPYVAASPIPQS